MTKYAKALEDLEEGFLKNKNSRYSFDILDLWGFDSRTDEAIIAIGLQAGKHMESIRRALRMAVMVEAGTHVILPKEPTTGMLTEANIYAGWGTLDETNKLASMSGVYDVFLKAAPDVLEG